MRVRMKGEISGTRNGRPWPPRGEVVDLSDAEAVQLLSLGMVVPVDPADVETAVAPPAETTRAPEPEKAARPAAEKRAARRPRTAKGNVTKE